MELEFSPVIRFHRKWLLLANIRLKGLFTNEVVSSYHLVSPRYLRVLGQNFETLENINTI
jgi:hypothetical protein